MKYETSSIELSWMSASARLLFGLFSHLEDGGDMFFRSAELFPNYAALQSRKCTLHNHCRENLKPKKLLIRLNYIYIN
jgi:hypothetical protein